MRFLTLSLFVCLCSFTLACRRLGPITLQPTIEDEAPLSNVIRVSDPASTSQLLNGFYDVEQNAWRWTAARFSVVLLAPPAARTKGAWLVLKFSLPDASIDALKTITLSCRLAGTELPSETFRTSGEHEYRREVPASAFTASFVKDTVAVAFSLDKFLKPPGDGRELGLIVTAIELEPK